MNQETRTGAARTGTVDDSQRARLARLKVRAAARRLLGEGIELVDVQLGSGAAVHDGLNAVVFADASDTEKKPYRGIGTAVAWAAKAGIEGQLHVVTEDDAGVLARLATHLAVPPQVWQLDTTTFVPAPASAQAWVATPAPTAAELAAIQPLLDAGADLVIEAGVVAAEVLGLEVGRVVNGELEIGVGRFDRAAAAVMEAVRGREDLISGVVKVVRQYRHPGAEPHVLNRLARERWLRADIVAEPHRVGAADLEPVETTVVRSSLIASVPAPAKGHRIDGAALVVATTTGVDLEAIVLAADARAAHAPEAHLIVALPARDHYPALVALATRLRQPAQLVALEGAWLG